VYIEHGRPLDFCGRQCAARYKSVGTHTRRPATAGPQNTENEAPPPPPGSSMCKVSSGGTLRDDLPTLSRTVLRGRYTSTTAVPSISAESDVPHSTKAQALSPQPVVLLVLQSKPQTLRCRHQPPRCAKSALCIALVDKILRIFRTVPHGRYTLTTDVPSISVESDVPHTSRALATNLELVADLSQHLLSKSAS
jgi:hypothetical protein